MDSVKAAKKSMGVEYRDRISELPDHVLIHILSLVLSAVDIKKTCILSTRWRNLWASVPNLEFSKSPSDDDCMGFRSFVDKFLQLRDPADLHTFSLDIYCATNFCLEHFKEWAGYAVRNNVKVLNFEFAINEYDLEFPDCIFNCPSLEELNLGFTFDDFQVHLKPPKFIDLSHLKTLDLQNCIIDGKSFERLISASPCLEELHMFFCSIGCSQISSHSLKSLSVENCMVPKVQISSPSLISFHYLQTNFTDILSLDNLSSLVTVSFYYVDYDNALSNLKLITSLSNMASLDFSVTRCKHIPKEEFAKFPTFHNLRDLTLRGLAMDRGHSQILAQFLRCSPNLELLILNYDEIHCLPKSGDVGFNCPHLAKIEMRIIKKNPLLNKLVDLLMASAEGLEEIKLTCR